MRESEFFKNKYITSPPLPPPQYCQKRPLKDACPALILKNLENTYGRCLYPMTGIANVSNKLRWFTLLTEKGLFFIHITLFLKMVSLLMF